MQVQLLVTPGLVYRMQVQLLATPGQHLAHPVHRMQVQTLDPLGTPIPGQQAPPPSTP